MNDIEKLRKQKRQTIEETKKLVAQIREREADYQSLDLADLESKGVIIKKGAWYLVPDMNKLPECLSHRITDIQVSSEGKGALVKFTKRKSPLSTTLKQFEKRGY